MRVAMRGAMRGDEIEAPAERYVSYFYAKGREVSGWAVVYRARRGLEAAVVLVEADRISRASLRAKRGPNASL